ncbi:MAG: hypothetical protein JXR58_03580 [Bacteroidales bacterium]|nr:hypothetical protein [Bacteroidales bacterium]
MKKIIKLLTFLSIIWTINTSVYSQSCTQTATTSGLDCDNIIAAVTINCAPAGATITGVSITASIGANCPAWYTFDIYLDGTISYFYCNGTYTFSTLNGNIANGTVIGIYSYDENFNCDAITLNLSVTVSYQDNSVEPQEGQDCGWAPTICSDATINGNSDGDGNIVDLDATNRGCLFGLEHQSQWFYFSSQTNGTVEFNINPDNGTDDYDFAIWQGINCPPTTAPVRCSYAAAYKQLENGFGTECHSFYVNNGDVITTDYQAGFYPNEEGYTIYDHNSIIIAAVGWGPWDISHTVINCPSGNCEYEICLDDSWGDGWDGLVFLYVNGINPFVQTGLQSGAGDNSESIWDDGYVNSLNVTAGQTYTVLIDNYYSTTSPYTLQWNLTNGASLDCSTLPVELTYFNGECNNNKVYLSWETASEINNDYFTIEKSFNGIDYFEIGTKKGAGTTSGVNFHYPFADQSEISNIQYYRLSQTDFDGKTEIFDPIAVKCSSQESENVTITNINNVAEIDFINKQGKTYEISIFDVMGRILYSNTISIDSNNQVIEIPLEKFSQKTIGISVVNSEELFTGKLMVP